MLDQLKRLDDRLIFRHLWDPERPWPPRWDRAGQPSALGRWSARRPDWTTLAGVLGFFALGFVTSPVGRILGGGEVDFPRALGFGLAFMLISIVPWRRRVVALGDAHDKWVRSRSH